MCIPPTQSEGERSGINCATASSGVITFEVRLTSCGVLSDGSIMGTLYGILGASAKLNQLDHWFILLNKDGRFSPLCYMELG